MAAGLAILGLLAEVEGYGIVFLGIAFYSVGWGSVMAPATTAIVNAVPPAKAGDASSVNQISRQSGGAFGVAVIGSVFAAAYALRVVDLFPARFEETASDSLGGALQSATSIGSEQLANASIRAFDEASQIAFLVAAVLTLAAALLARLTVPPKAEPES
jgi:hypothetical protein